MAGPRRYKLLCPIARALDRIGDRWTLLILRDLHAGPARFSDLIHGLQGAAPNLLTDRLRQLTDDGIVAKRDAEFGVTLYELTRLGERTRDLLFELAMFGGRFPPDEDVRRPGNLRTIAVTLSAACQRVVRTETDLNAEIVVDGEPFTLIAKNGAVSVRQTQADNPDVTMTTSYEPMVDVADGRMTLEDYATKHATLVAHRPAKDTELMGLLAAAMGAIAAEE